MPKPHTALLIALDEVLTFICLLALNDSCLPCRSLSTLCCCHGRVITDCVEKLSVVVCPEAAKYFGEAARIGKVDGDLLRKQGNALMIVEDFSGAVKAYQDALDAGVKREGLVYMALAEAEFYRENWKKAHVAIKKAMEDKSTAKSARGWESYIRDTAERKGVAL